MTKVVFDPSFALARPSTTYTWFFNMQNLQTIEGMEYLNTSEVTNMAYMFGLCTSLTSLGLSSFNTSKVTNMKGMFDGCGGLKSLNLSSFNTSKVNEMSNMFYECFNLLSIFVGNAWTTSTVDSSGRMFYSCNSLVGGQGTTYSSSNPQDKTYAHIDGGASNPGYFTATGTQAYACYTSSNTTLTFYYDTQRSSRPGTTYSLNTGENDPGWKTDGTNANVTKVVFDPSFAGAHPTTTCLWFYLMRNLQTIEGIEYLNTSEVTNMAHMFNSCFRLTSLDLSSFNTSKVTDMRIMFYNCSGLTSLDLGGFYTAYVTNMFNMFGNCSSLRTVYVDGGLWWTGAVTNSSLMFSGCTSLVGGVGTTYDANHIDKAYAHVDGGPSNPGYFTDAGTVAYACYRPESRTLTFYYDAYRINRPGTTYDLNTGARDPGWYTDSTYANVTKVVFDPSFAGARPTTTYEWFYVMKKLQSITGMDYLNTSEVTDMRYMFCGCNKLTSIDLSYFNTSKVTHMYSMFYGCSALTSLDLSGFNTSNVVGMTNMFRNCGSLRTITVGEGWSTDAVTYSDNMFGDDISLVGGQGTTWNESNPKDKTYAHIDGGASDPGYFTAAGTQAYACYTPENTTLTFYHDTERSTRPGTTYDLNTGQDDTAWGADEIDANVTQVVFDPSFANARPTTTYSWFFGMQNLQAIEGMEYLNTSEVTNMWRMFALCSELTSLDLSHFNTSKVTSMAYMFYRCTGLTSLDLSSFNTSNVTDMSAMFYNSPNLTTIYAGEGWSTEAVTNSTQMFNYATSLVGGQGTTYDASHIDAAYAHIDGGASNPGYFTDKNASMRGDVDSDGHVDINDVTKLIGVVLGTTTTGYNAAAADCDVAGGSGNIDINDVTALLNFVLNGHW